MNYGVAELRATLYAEASAKALAQITCEAQITAAGQRFNTFIFLLPACRQAGCLLSFNR
jgi:hypothetical protein